MASSGLGTRRAKREAVIVETSRRLLIDEAAPVRALREGTIGSAGHVEPLPAGHPLRGMPDLVATPHLGCLTAAAYRTYFRHAVKDTAASAAGAPLRLLPGRVRSAGPT